MDNSINRYDMSIYAIKAFNYSVRNAVLENTEEDSTQRSYSQKNIERRGVEKPLEKEEEKMMEIMERVAKALVILLQSWSFLCMKRQGESV
jgi:DNA topoisomerase IB